MYNDILKALEFSSKVHKHQRREFSNEPYINHPIRVANNPVVVSLGSDAICVGLLHDCIEDGEYPEEIDLYIKTNFSSNVYETCLLLTHNRLVENYDSYKAKVLASNNKIALAVKYADSLDNSKPESSMSDQWIERCKKYLIYSNKYKEVLDSLPNESVSPKRTWNGIEIASQHSNDGMILLQSN